MSFSLAGREEHFFPEFDAMRKGWLITRAKGIALLSAFVISVVVTGVAVHYLSPDRGDYCPPKSSNDEQRQKTTGEGTTKSALSVVRPTSSPAKAIRLTRDLVPIHYSLRLIPDFYGNETSEFHFRGSVNIRMRCLVSTSAIILHSKELRIEGEVRLVQLEPIDRGSSMTVTGISKNEEQELLTVTVDRPLLVGSQYEMELNFIGKLKDDMKGIYWSSYTEGSATKRLMTSQMEPTYARKVFPCFDEPNFKATFDVIIVRKENMTSLSNMELINSTRISDEWIEDHFNCTPVPMSTYLLAFTVCTEFSYIENFTRNGTRFRIYARREVISNARYALEIGIKIQEFFEEYFNITYPLSKQDMLAVPDFASGAMENWGLIIYRETALLFDPATSSLANKVRVATVIAHELAHQWFGNWVSPEWWDDLWLNEGFASYFEYIGVNFAEPEWNFMDHFLTDDLQSVFSLDSLNSSHPIYFKINSNDDINSVFDSITYSKGAAIIRMMQNFLGENTFSAGLKRYLNRNRLSNANHKDLWSAFNEEQMAFDGINRMLNVTSVMDGWLKQTGYPVLTFHLPRRNTSGENAMKITQQRFLIQRTKDYENNQDKTLWNVPLTFTFSTQLNWSKPHFQWISDREVFVPIGEDHFWSGSSGAWVIGNIGQFGYYRVNYDQENWKNLINQLNTNHEVIPVKNRAQIIDDAFQIRREGLIDELIEFQATEYLSRETELIPWRTAMTNIFYVASMLDRSPAYGLLEELNLKRLVPLYDRLGWNERQDDSIDTKLLRSDMIRWSCFYGHRACLNRAIELYKGWMNSTVTIPGDIRQTVLCYGIEEGGRLEWDVAFDRYQRETKADEMSRLLFALSCSKIPWILNRYLNYTWEKIRKQDAPHAFSYIARNPIGRYLAWNFFINQWKNIKERYADGVFLLPHMIKSTTAAFNTWNELQQLRSFGESSSTELGVGCLAYDQSIEKTQLNIEWMARNEERIFNWLQKQNKTK